jgi:rubredoxin
LELENGKSGLPVLDNAVSYVHCRVREEIELSTHILFICEVIDAWNGRNQSRPLVYGDYQKSLKAAANEAFKIFQETGKPPKAALKEQYVCGVCDHKYGGDVPFEELATDWTCPICGVGREMFTRQGGEISEKSIGGKWVCGICGYEYDGEIPFEELPEGWTCPICGVGKELFERA